MFVRDHFKRRKPCEEKSKWRDTLGIKFPNKSSFEISLLHSVESILLHYIGIWSVVKSNCPKNNGQIMVNDFMESKRNICGS